MRILIIEDEKKIAENIKKGIESIPSWTVDLCHNGEDGLHMALNEPYNVIILDLMLPKMDGLDILTHLRKSGKTTPVLILTAKNTEKDIIKGLDYGSDDYLGKPFDMGVLLARIKALVRRYYNKPNPIITIGDLKIDTSTHQVSRNNVQIQLPNLEYRLLEYLAFNADKVVSKTDLSEHIYDYNWEKFSNVIEVYIYTLRSKIDQDHKQKLIHTLRGQGYILSDKK